MYVTSVLVDFLVMKNVTTVGSVVGETKLVGCAVCPLDIGAAMIDNK